MQLAGGSRGGSGLRAGAGSAMSVHDRPHFSCRNPPLSQSRCCDLLVRAPSCLDLPAHSPSRHVFLAQLCPSRPAASVAGLWRVLHWHCSAAPLGSDTVPARPCFRLWATTSRSSPTAVGSDSCSASGCRPTRPGLCLSRTNQPRLFPLLVLIRPRRHGFFLRTVARYSYNYWDRVYSPSTSTPAWKLCPSDSATHFLPLIGLPRASSNLSSDPSRPVASALFALCHCRLSPRVPVFHPSRAHEPCWPSVSYEYEPRCSVLSGKTYGSSFHCASLTATSSLYHFATRSTSPSLSLFSMLLLPTDSFHIPSDPFDAPLSPALSGILPISPGYSPPSIAETLVTNLCSRGRSPCQSHRRTELSRVETSSVVGY
jgi:hypothetical protein